MGVAEIAGEHALDGRVVVDEVVASSAVADAYGARTATTFDVVGADLDDGRGWAGGVERVVARYLAEQKLAIFHLHPLVAGTAEGHQVIQPVGFQVMVVLASLTTLPTVVLFGPETPLLYGPLLVWRCRLR